MTKKINIGLFGFGCVGQGLWDVLESNTGIDAQIAKIAVKHRDKKRSLPASYFTYSADDLLNNPDLDLIVELINDPEDAHRIVTSAMKKGKNVVSANKKLIAEHLAELVNLQEETNTSLLYEAAACGSIPIIRTIEEYYVTELLYSVQGIVNGSTNYILTKMYNEGSDYYDVLRQAQELGFAETDPTLDVGGFDAKYKIVILTWHSFGVIVHPDEVFNYGIQQLNARDMQYAKEKGLKIKLVAKVYRTGQAITAFVMPQFVGREDNLFGVDYEYNGVTVEAAFSDKQFFRGKGAGGHPTGSAVLSDIAACSYNYRYEYHKGTNGGLVFTRDVVLDVYFRYTHRSQLAEERFVSIRERYESEQFNYIIGKVRLQDLYESPYFRQAGTFLVQV